MFTYLGFLSRINENCQKMAGSAQTLVGPDDVLVVYGYCRNIAEFLRNLPRQNRNVLYIVDFDDKIEKARIGSDEDQKIWTYANKLGFAQVVFVSPAAFPEALNDLQRRGIPCKVLLGTHGVLKSQDSHCREFLCRVGSYVLALAADGAKKKGLNAKVFVFAQRTQFLTNGESDEEVAKPDSLFSTGDCERHPVIIGANCLTPKIDFVPKDLVDLVVTEEGALELDALSFESAQAKNKSST